MPDVYVVSATRTPFARINGTLSRFLAIELGAAAIHAAVTRSGIPPELPSHVYMGHALQAGTGQAPAKQAAICAGLPVTVEATSINKVCASGLKAVCLAAQEILIGHASAQIAGGMESMSNVPLYTRKKRMIADCNESTGDEQSDGLLDGLGNSYDGVLMGGCADQLAARYHIEREDQDEWALAAYQRAATAFAKETFREEIAPVPHQGNGFKQVSADEVKDKAVFQELSRLSPAFSATGTVTAGTSSFLSDGASAVVLANATVARQYCRDAKILAKIISFADASAPPADFAVAPSKAIQIALERAQLTVDQISLWEINEAFALVVMVNEEILGLDPEKVNVNGGAIAFGHPLGSSGCRILVSLLHQLKPGQYGVAAICNGGGGSTAMVVERLNVESLDSATM
ncbi:putative acetyl-CoA acetyltransferase [Cladobotryum mycophilum]|uniref:Acetyl-CoA acetyltransferase n=1 Tax=Cladobotryum mycophilum TaxID=491253 RepID=A0ABR0T3Y7_9HYPO